MTFHEHINSMNIGHMQSPCRATSFVASGQMMRYILFECLLKQMLLLYSIKYKMELIL